MSDATAALHLKYIKEHVVPDIVAQLEHETLESFEAEHSGGLDGFMSALYNIQLKTKTPAGIKERLLMAKFMKGDTNFRESSKAYVQFANEIFIYSKALPVYAQLLKEANIEHVSVEDWVAHAYLAKFGYIKDLSATSSERESLLVLENLKPLGYKMGPLPYLNREHLLLMSRKVGQYHACSYALHLLDEPQLARLKREIIPLPFINDSDPNDVNSNLYRVLYRLAFDRLFDFFDREIDGNALYQHAADDVKLIECLKKLRQKYYDEPTRLLERIRTGVEDLEEDRHFGVILHGDYNRNNVLFHYKAEGAEEIVDDVKMIDFQELRYGTPAIDLSFYMYINTSEDIRDKVWMDVLKEYHKNMYELLAAIVKGRNNTQAELEQIDKKLQNYSFEKFYAHFARSAFYGVMICLHFLPWLLCTKEECARLAQLFETDMHGAEFRKISIEAGGDKVNLQLLAILKHACKMGYMDNI